MKQIFQYKELFHFESGARLPNLNIAYHTFGKRSVADDNIIWVFHALTANSDVSEWWPTLFGQNNILDPDKYFIICANVIGSPYGSSCPSDLHFPMFTVRDVCRLHMLLAEELNIRQIYLAIGGSFGGDQALEFAHSFQGKIQNLVLIACSAKESAWAIAVHETQRLALKSDPTFGLLNGGQEGIKAARAIGMLTYRTSQLFIDKQTDDQEKLDDFMASSYIKYQGDKFADRFTALSYYYLTKCLDSHDIGRNRGGIKTALTRINIPSLVIGIDSDMLIPTNLQKELAEFLPSAAYEEIHSDSGHDGFLIEGPRIANCIKEFLGKNKRECTVHKFGGKSLANGTPIKQALKIIVDAHQTGHHVIIVSARGNTTDRLLDLYRLALNNENYQEELDQLLAYQKNDSDIDLTKLETDLTATLGATAILGVDNHDIANKVIAFGELFSAEAISFWLKKSGISVQCIDARAIIKSIYEKGDYSVDVKKSRTLTRALLMNLDENVIPVITGFISSDEKGKTTNLGRNGSNYTASLIASFIQAKSVYNWTDVNGIYSANPKYVQNAKLISHLSFREANELANFGTHVLHSKTILPLIENDIPIFVKNSHHPELPGTRVDSLGSEKGIKAVSAIDDISLIAIEGAGLLGKVGIDSRIFSCLSNNHISVRLISQASSERGIGFVVDKAFAELTIRVLHEEFMEELSSQAISSIRANNNVAIIAITGRHNYALEKAIQGLRKNKIWIHLFSNSISGENISLVVDNSKIYNAVNVVHEYVV
jgi:homoserine O-acetyltransferase